MKIGDKVRILTLPPDLQEGELKTRPLFKLCVGRTFSIVGLQGNLLELEVGEVLGKAPYMDSIWIGRKHVDIVATSD
jgi:hypothetical protein